jgi:hypothetical protein
LGTSEQDPGRVCLSVEATHISVIYLRPAFDLLGKPDVRLPATFYRMLMSGVSECILCYDEAEAARYLEYRRKSTRNSKQRVKRVWKNRSRSRRPRAVGSAKT